MPDYTLKLEDAPQTSAPVVEDGGYLIGTTEQAEADRTEAAAYKGTRTPANPVVQQAMRETRRKMVLDLAQVLYLNESGSILKTREFDKSDVSCQKYIRMAEAAFDWMIKR